MSNETIKTIEKMTDFFTARVDNYEEHMLNWVPGCSEGYKLMAKMIPNDTRGIVDLGCGTGLELDEIYKLHPDISVTGIDLTKAMLDQLWLKHQDKKPILINNSYFDFDFGSELWDGVISFQTMHHFSKEKKLDFYTKIAEGIKKGGFYIEVDYMIEDQVTEDFYFEENRRIRLEEGVLENEFYHYDTPCTINNQIALFKAAGFNQVEMVWRVENTTMIVSKKMN